MRLYDTATRGPKELPAPPGPVRMYFCGPTVYARAHVGNARPYVVGMWMRRWLRESGYDATLVHNITDVDDKILAAPGPSAEVAARATAWYVEDIRGLGLGLPDGLPKATETIPQIILFIQELVAREAAYAVAGDVYFRVSRDPEYGRLSGQRPDQMEEQEPNPLKEDPRDFALWKANKPGEDLVWESPWGPGRPGWHIECSVMAEEAFGPVFEIHGGGLDLVFPHHENEYAQSRALGHEFARIWAHNGMLRFTGEKMSKSVGNVVTLREALDEWGPETLLVYFLGGHWRKPLDYSDMSLGQAASQVATFRNAFLNQRPPSDGRPWEDFAAALNDDFNTPRALEILNDWSQTRNKQLLERGLEVFGLESLAESASAPPELVQLARQRAQARGRKDFDESDRLRGEIEAAGWQVRDVDAEPGFQLVPKR